MINLLPTKDGEYKKANAAGQYFGYALQAVRMCHYLQAVSEDICEITLEGVEDIEVYSPKRGWILEQCKSGLTHNPVADWAKDLWKTFAHWVKLVEGERVDPERTQFRLYLAQDYTGNLVSTLNRAEDEGIIRVILHDIRKKFSSKQPKGVKAYVERVLACDDSLLFSIIKNFSFKSGASAPYSSIERQLKLTVSQNILNDVVVSAVGWVTKEANCKILNKQRATILHKDYRNWLQGFLQQNDRNHLLPRLSYNPSRPKIDEVLDDFPYFIRQLDVIGASSTEKVRAATDYLKTYAQKAQWAALGIVQRESFEEYKEELKVAWELNHSDILIRFCNLPLEQQGKLLLNSCLRDQGRQIDFKPLPEFYSRGEYHNLAGGEESTFEAILGWHPNYKDIFEE